MDKMPLLGTYYENFRKTLITAKDNDRRKFSSKSIADMDRAVEELKKKYDEELSHVKTEAGFNNKHKDVLERSSAQCKLRLYISKQCPFMAKNYLVDTNPS